MKLRPQFNLRFRDAAQFELVRSAALGSGKSMNQWILDRFQEGRSETEEDALVNKGIAAILDRMTEKPCRACESDLVVVKGRMVCMEEACSMRGLEQ